MAREAGDASYETDRMKFIGRGNTVANPQAMTSAAPLSNSDGAVLDPIVAIRRQIALDGGESVTVDIVTGVAETREASLLLVEKYRDRRLADRVFELAWTHSQVLLRQINATEGDAQLYGQLAGAVVYCQSGAARRPWRPGAEPPRAIRPVELLHFGRSTDRAGADRRHHEHGTGPPARAGAGILAVERPHRRPDDLERRSLRLPAGAAGPDSGPDLGGRRTAS